MKDTIWIKKGRFTPLAILLMLALPLTTSVICLCFGRMNVPVGEVLTALRTALTGGSAANVQNYSIVINLRLPRILMAIIVGAGLTCAGNTFQSLFSNPLATPDILGVTSGTCVGAILAIILSCSILETQLIALVFGLASVCFTLKIAEEKNIPVLGTKRSTSEFMAELIYCLNEQLAPCITIHGVLVDVYGEGLLIMGESGIGKSEAALELIKRGHRLVTDDVVEIRKINEHTLIGTSPDITRYFIELRGIGIIDVKTLFGVECVKEKQQIDLVIKLEDWKKENEYDRLGLEEEYTEFLGNKVVCHSLPIRPGRNLAVICEAAAVNHRQKKMGYNAAQELYRRVQENLTKKSSDDDE